MSETKIHCIGANHFRPRGIPLAATRAIASPSIQPDVPASNRFKSIKDTICHPVSTPQVKGLWHFQGPPGKPTKASACDKVIFFIHGGAYIFGNSQASLVQHLRIAEVLDDHNVKLAVFGLKYSFAPENQWPKPVNEALAAYRWLTEEEGVDPSNVILMGESAGGHLVMSLLYEISRQQLRRPGHACLMFPWLNLTNRSTSFDRNKHKDLLSQPNLDWAAEKMVPLSVRKKYAEIVDFNRPVPGARSLKDVLPTSTWISVGSHDVFVDDIVRFVKRAQNDGARVDLEIEPDLPHGWNAFLDLSSVSGYLSLGPRDDAKGVLKAAEKIANGLLSIFR